MRGMFGFCSSLTSIRFDNLFVTSHVLNMSFTLASYSALLSFIYRIFVQETS